MDVTFVLLLISLQLMLITGANGEDKKQPLSLGMMKRSGFYEAMKNKNSMVDYFYGMLKEGHTVSGTIIDMSNKHGLEKVGSESMKGQERSGIADGLHTHAGCQPYDTIVDIPNNRSDVIMYPSCIRVKRCGGCCTHHSLTCKATKSNNTYVKVMKFVYDGSSIYPDERVEYVAVSQDHACQCSCKVQASDCKSIQVYDPQECKCVCRNQDQSTQCAANQIWSQEYCACQCANIIQCGNGYKYNMKTCRCEEDVQRSVNVPTRPPQPQPDVAPPAEVEEVNLCPATRCPRGYTAKFFERLGRCHCMYG